MTYLNLPSVEVPVQAKSSPTQIQSEIESIRAKIQQLESDLAGVAEANSKYIINGQQDVNRYNRDRVTLDQLRSRLTELNLEIGSATSIGRDWNKYAKDEAESYIANRIAKVPQEVQKALLVNFGSQFTQVLSGGYFLSPANQTLTQVGAVIKTIFDSSLGAAIIEQGEAAQLNPLPNAEGVPGAINVPGADDLTKTLLAGYQPKRVQTLAEKRRAQLGVQNG